MIRSATLIAVSLLATATLARGDDGAVPMGPSPNTALALSLGVTAGGIAAGTGIWFASGGSGADANNGHWVGFLVASSSLVAGPSLGHFYAGEVGRGLLTTGLRAALVGGAVIFTVGPAVSCAVGSAVAAEGPSDCDLTGWFVLSGLFASGAVALAVYDIWDAPRAARRAQPRAPTLSLAPILGPSTYGLGLAGTF